MYVCTQYKYKYDLGEEVNGQLEGVCFLLTMRVPEIKLRMSCLVSGVSILCTILPGHVNIYVFKI